MTAIVSESNRWIAIKSDGTVWTAGDTQPEAPGMHTGPYTPVQVPGLTGAVNVAVGGTHGLALKPDGTVWAWGHNENGQSGDGGAASRTAPVQVAGLAGVTAVAAGDAHSLAVTRDGRLLEEGG